MFKFPSLKRLIEPAKDPQVVIAQIHDEFDSSTERLLNEAKNILSQNNDVSKGERLIKLGFVNAAKASEAAAIKKQKEISEKTAKSIEYFKQNYPFQKFITEEEVEKICKKFGLVIGRSTYYIGEIPEKNILEMERFKLKDEDSKRIDYHWMTWLNGTATRCDKNTSNSRYGYLYSRGWGTFCFISDETQTHHFEKDEYKICAPIKDFQKDSMRIEKGYKLELNLPDPVVLQPVKDGYLIVTKWGLEAEDKALLNEINN